MTHISFLVIIFALTVNWALSIGITRMLLVANQPILGLMVFGFGLLCLFLAFFMGLYKLTKGD